MGPLGPFGPWAHLGLGPILGLGLMWARGPYGPWAHMGPRTIWAGPLWAGPFGPGPIWAPGPNGPLAQMGHSPYGRWAQMGPRPKWALGPYGPRAHTLDFPMLGPMKNEKGHFQARQQMRNCHIYIYIIYIYIYEGKALSR